MSRKGNRGQARHTTHAPNIRPKLYECEKHGVQRHIGVKFQNLLICMDCFMEFLAANCCQLTEFTGELKDE